MVSAFLEFPFVVFKRAVIMLGLRWMGRSRSVGGELDYRAWGDPGTFSAKAKGDLSSKNGVSLCPI